MVDVSEVKAAYTSSRLDMARFILVMFFMVEQRWRYIIEKELEPDGITAKQWLMTIVIASGFKHPPSIQEVADAMSTTHQNVKQIAASMERRGFMALERDQENKRIIRLKVTDKCRALFERRGESDARAVLGLFENLTDEEVKALFNIIAKMEHRADRMYNDARAERLGRGERAALRLLRLTGRYKKGTMMAQISPERLRALRAYAQHLFVKASRDDMNDVVRSLCGVNAQSEPAMMLSLRARVEGLEAADVVRAIEQKRLVRTWAMRGTLHLLDRDDLGWMVSLLGPPIIASGRRRRLELGLTDEILAKSLGEIPVVLNDGPLTRGELAGRLASRGIEIDRTGQAPYHLIAYAALKGLIFMGPDSRDGDHTYCIFEGGVKERAQYSRDEALARLIRRYLGGYGPAAPEDFAAWSGLSIADARKGRELNKEALAELEVDGRSLLWTSVTPLWPPDVPTSADTVVNLLPAFDAYVLGYTRREHLVRPEHQDKVYHGGQTVPMVLVNGLAEGVWRYERRGKRLAIKISPFGPLGKTVKGLIAEEAEDIGRFFGLSPRLFIPER